MADIENTIIVGSGPAGYTAALYTARANLAAAGDRGVCVGRAVAADDRRRELPRLPGGDDGSGADGQDARPGRALRRTAGDRPGRARAARERARGRALRVGGRHRAPRAHRDPRDGCRAQAAGGARRAGARRQGRELLRHLRRGFLQGRPDGDRRRRGLGDGGGDLPLEVCLQVAVVHRRQEWRASKIMLERAREQENIEFLTPYTIKEFLPGESGALDRAVLFDAGSGEEREPGDQAALHRGRAPAPVRAGARAGGGGRERVCGHRGPLHPYQPPWRVCCRGPRRPHLPPGGHRRGSGCQAALDAEWYLRDTPEVPTPAGLPVGDLAEEQWARPPVQTTGGD